jgi:UDP-glucose 4-epimerase
VADIASVLVTGGAGYIGSHVVQQLRARGTPVVVLDNLATGFRQAVQDAPLVVGDVADRALVDRVIAGHGVGAVMHLAGSSVVPEAMREPLKYYGNNSAATRVLLEACLQAGVHRFIFSSSAAVYGMPPDGIARESAIPAPINPYGRSKLVCEWQLHDLAAASELRYVALRYFNVAGADPQGRIGQATARAMPLVKVACEHAVGKRGHLSVLGTDYPTPDGTGVRDYIHVSDLARAHLDALDYLAGGGDSQVLNAGYGHGYSVREVFASVQRAAGRPLVLREEPRRAGDPPSVVAANERLREVLGWRPRFDDLDTMVRTALAWEQALLREPW